jgi:hypothetical protein
MTDTTSIDQTVTVGNYKNPPPSPFAKGGGYISLFIKGDGRDSIKLFLMQSTMMACHTLTKESPLGIITIPLNPPFSKGEVAPPF